MINHSISPYAVALTLARYGELIRRLVVREFSAKYRGSMLGVAWAIVTPLILAVVFVFVFGTVFEAKWGTEAQPKASFTVMFLVGMIVHGIFAEAISRAPGIIVQSPAYVKKIVFPLEILPVVLVASALITALIGMAIVLLLHFALSGTVSPMLPLLPVVLFPFAMAVLGLVFFLSSIGVYFRDLTQIIGLVVTASLFMAPIFYPLSAVPEPYRMMLHLNPLTFPVEQARTVALYGEAPDWWGLAVYLVASSVVAWLGFAWFQKTRKGFADVI